MFSAPVKHGFGRCWKLVFCYNVSLYENGSIDTLL